ncbi:MAG: dihydrodipicolinate synthase family protein, partial [Hyphomonas sp.]|uniref:dihydrodipicolinate synthase family protein n=1 Tax=Hyphomonas sp. TaxID=87 RepID=UPI001DB82112
CAFPLTPADSEGVVDVDAVGLLIDRLAAAGVASIGLLGSTGGFAYLDGRQRQRATQAAVEAAAGRVPIIVGIGALRTSWSRHLARDAEQAGAAGLLLQPTSYLPLTPAEVGDHYRTIAIETDLPLCIYNNPGSTNFVFSHDLIVDLATIPNIVAIKMPPLSDDAYAVELDRLRPRLSDTFRIGYSGDWVASASLLAGADAWFSVIGGLLPIPALQLTRAAISNDKAAADELDRAFEPLWKLFREHGSFRLLYVIADRLKLPLGDPPPPIRRVDASIIEAVEHAMETMAATSRPGGF